MRVLFLILGVVTIVVLAVVSYGRRRWSSNTRDVHNRLAATRAPVRSTVYHARELDGLPHAVQRYFRAVLTDGQPIISDVHLEHAGTFNASETSAAWKRFTSSQRVLTKRPGFDWDARIAMMPGLSVFVRDAYVGGEGILRASVLGLFTMVDQRGGHDLAQGELMRFLAEAAWYPTALLPSQGVGWEPVDDHSARATLADDDVAVKLVFHFGESGTIDTVSAESRGRTRGGRVEHMPWQCRLWNYQRRDGLLVPADGEVSWVTDEGEKPYWRGRIARISYEYARSDDTLHKGES